MLYVTIKDDMDIPLKMIPGLAMPGTSSFGSGVEGGGRRDAGDDILGRSLIPAFIY